MGDADIEIDPALETAYNCRAAVPDHADIFETWAERSANARHAEGRALRRNVPYGPRPRWDMDLFGAGVGGRPRPLLMILHGGYWQAMDKSASSFLAPPFVEAGAVVAVANYPLCPAEPLPAITHALREAVQFLWHESSGLGIDRHRFVVAGHSAGAHLAAELLCTRWPALDSTMPLDTLRSGILVSGLFDLEPLCRTSLNRALGLDADAARRNSPLYRDPVPGTSVTLAVGEHESDAFHSQSARLLRSWTAMGANATWVSLPGRHHFSAIEALAEPESALYRYALGRLRLPLPRTTADLTGAKPEPKV
jgi:arylformamidase